MKLDKGTFGSIEKYKMLEFLTERIDDMGIREKEYVSSVLHDFNKCMKRFDGMNVAERGFKIYLLNLVHKDYIARIDKFMTGKYEEKVVTYLKNYIYAKISNERKKQ
jgi:hypothetical protein